MEILLFSLQKLEKEKDKLEKNKELAEFKKELQKKKKEIQEVINSYNNMKEQKVIIDKDVKRMEDENNYFLEEIKNKEKVLYNNSEANFKELESIKDKIEELKSSFSEKEEEHLELLAASEELEEGIKKEKEFIYNKKQEFNKELNEFKELEKENLYIIEKKDKEIKKMIKKIDKEEYSKYQSMQKKYPLSGIAVIEEGDKCSYCRINASVVKLREVENNDITYCESCSRLLVGKKEDIK